MQFLAVLKLRPDTPPEKVGPLVKPEAAKAWEMLAAGVLRSLHIIRGAHAPAGATLLLECGDLQEAEAHLKQLPLVAQDLVSVEVLPLAPFTGFAALFAPPAV
jgi:hypothetical protein